MSEQPAQNRIERRKLEFRDNITQAAIRLFEERGISETSVAAIIKEADIAHKTFFNHFPTKDHLLLHVASTFSAQAYDAFDLGLARYKDPAKRLDYIMMIIARTIEGVKPHYRELLNVYLISGAGSGVLQKQQKEAFSAVMSDILTEAKKEGRLKSGLTVETCTDMVVGICLALLLNWSTEDRYPIVDKMKNASKFLNQAMFADK